MFISNLKKTSGIVGSDSIILLWVPLYSVRLQWNLNRIILKYEVEERYRD